MPFLSAPAGMLTLGTLVTGADGVTRCSGIAGGFVEAKGAVTWNAAHDGVTIAPSTFAQKVGDCVLP